MKRSTPILKKSATMIEDEERPVADRMEGLPLPGESRELIGHDAALTALQDAWRSGRLHHAWLISGPRGIGKSTLAFHFAKQLLSAAGQPLPDQRGEGPRIDPAVAGQIAQGAHPNLLHLTRPYDSKAKRFKTQLSVDEIRKTQSFYGLTAGADGWRVTIVDSADDMNASAANALLKILEEPPKKSIFLVITHSPGRLLPTIRSRCRFLPLKPLPEGDILSLLKRLGIDGDPDVMLHAARLSGGSVRRAAQLVQGDVVQHFQTFEKLMEQGAVGSASEWQAVHRIGDVLATKQAAETHDLFTDLVLAWVGSRARFDAGQVSSAVLAGWAEVWEKATRTVHRADAFNLDRKQVVLTLFGLLFERNRT